MQHNTLCCFKDFSDILGDVVIDVDSELHITGCQCSDQIPSNACKCPLYATPLRCSFSKNADLEGTQKLYEIEQRKGEAEMTVMDWVIGAKSELLPGDSVASIITSGDIDAVVIHSFCLPLQWPRDSNGCYLQKPGGCNIRVSTIQIQ